jgi:menaquinone-dependent protoporphyrinogen oxidase
MKKMLIVYESPYGQTRIIADYLATEFRNAGIEVNVETADDYPSAYYDVIVVGAPVYVTSFPRTLVDWLERHAPALNESSFAFFTVSATAASKNPKKIEELEVLTDKFLNEHGLRPDIVNHFAGAIHYRDYNWIMRWMMKRICAKEGGPTDTSRNHVLTDWRDVDEFAETVIDALKDQPVVLR